LLDVADYYRPLLAFFDHAVTEQFVRAEHRDLILADTDAARLIDALDTWTPPPLGKAFNPASLPAP
jgi:predicted Rossmann-fold nucleotide-binding protein